MPAGLKRMEAHIRESARKKGIGGKDLDDYVYATLNKKGYMHGSKVTAKGRKVGRK